MTNSWYQVIRFNGDPVRNEPRNIGIVVTSPEGPIAHFDELAKRRALRENPQLSDRFLTDLEDVVEQFLIKLNGDPFPDEIWDGTLEFTEPRMVRIEPRDPKALEAAFDELMTRFVRPATRHAETSEPVHQRPETYFNHRLASLVRRRLVTPGYEFQTDRAGIVRPVSYYANSGTNVVLDILQLAVERQQERELRTDAELVKIDDITRNNPINQFIVYVHLSDDPKIAAESKDRVHSILRESNVLLVENREEAAEQFEQIIGPSAMAM
jgi:hypothetical protein